MIRAEGWLPRLGKYIASAHQPVPTIPTRTTSDMVTSPRSSGASLSDLGLCRPELALVFGRLGTPIGPGSRRQREGSGVKRATVSADGETITVHIPLTFRKRGGRKLVVTPDGAEWAPRPRVDNAMVKALARAFRWRKMLDEGVHATLEDLARAKGVARDLCQPGPAADAARAGDRRGDPRRAAAGGAAAG